MAFASKKMSNGPKICPHPPKRSCTCTMSLCFHVYCCISWGAHTPHTVGGRTRESSAAKTSLFPVMKRHETFRGFF